MSLIVSDAIDRIERELNEVGQNADENDHILFLNNAVDWLYQTYHLPTAKRVTDILFYPGVREYSLPADFVAPISPRKTGALLPSSTFARTTERSIYVDVGNRTFAIEYDEDTPFLVAVNDEAGQTMLHDCETATGVTISGDGSNLQVDDTVFAGGENALQFTVTPNTGTTTLTFALTSQIDISNIATTMRGFFNLYCPRTNTVALTNVKLRIGNDSSNYYQWTKTTRYRGQTIKGGWGVIGAYFEQLNLLTQDGDNLLTEDGSEILLEGSVNLEEIDWVQIEINHGTTGVSGLYRLDDIFLSKGAYYEFPYYSAYVIEAETTGTLQEKITSAGDTILLPLRCDGVVVYKALEFLCAERKQQSGLANYFRSLSDAAERSIRGQFPKQTSLATASWYPTNR